MGLAPRMVKATKYAEAWTGFTNARKNWAYRQDQLPSTHPIAADNHDLEAVEVNFDGITYAKGASALKQLVAWVGEDEFLAGLRAYFKKHAFGNTEFTDLLSALEASSGRDLQSWAEEWLQTSGVNTLAPELRGRRRRRLHVVRRAPDAPPGLPDAAPAPASRSACTTATRTAGLVRRTSLETDIAGERTDVAELVGDEAARPGAAQRRRPHLRQDPARRAVAGRPWSAARRPLDDSLARALCWGAAWDMTRDAEMRADRLRRAGARRASAPRPT